MIDLDWAMSLLYAILLFGTGIVLRIKKVPTRFHKSGERETVLNGIPLQSQKQKRVEQLKRGNIFPFFKAYQDYICYAVGILAICRFAKPFLEKMYYDLTRLFLFIFGVFVCIAVGILLQLISNMGKKERIKTIRGVVKKYIPITDNSIFPNSYHIEVEYDINGMKDTYIVKHSYEKKELPKLGSEYPLLYSYEYKKLLSKVERRSYTRWSTFCFGLAVFMVILMIFA